MNLTGCLNTEIFKSMKHCWYLWVSAWNPANNNDLCLILSHSTATDVIIADVRLIMTQYDLPQNTIPENIILVIKKTTVCHNFLLHLLYVFGG